MAGNVALEDSVQFVRGVGPDRAKAFAQLGVHTVGDLIEYFPFRHELKPRSQAIDTLELGVVATVVGELRRVRTQGRHGQQRVTAHVVDGTGKCRVTWFNSPFLVDRLYPGQIVRLTGKVDLYGDLASFANPQFTIIDERDDDPLANDSDRYDPVYAGLAQLQTGQIARIIGSVLDEAAEAVVDFVPESFRTRRNLPPRRTAILRYHRPVTSEDVPVARRRLAYDELLLCQLAVQLGRRALARGPKAKPVTTSDEIDRRIRNRFPFPLTEGQDRAISEIRVDLARTQPMNRLLQADVGAGKTAVAVYAALAAIANGRQVAMLAPTEVLAAQHRTKIGHYLEGSRVRTGYLVGSTARAKRGALLIALKAGEVDFLIGTHAVLEQDVRFHKLGLVIIDEQHKFGVAQRATLRRKGYAPHCLVLTATPIPRTLAMTVFGDLDVSTIDGILPNRQPVVTRLVTPEKAGEAWAFVRSRLDRDEQAYIVYPLVEESEALPLRAATVEVERLSQSTLSGYRVGLLHGRMKPAEKAEVMNRFRTGELQALVSTTVIEVGVDVPNATMMIVQHAERYGLSQLHQLRGRIGRGSKKSYCLLFAEGRSGSARHSDVVGRSGSARHSDVVGRSGSARHSDVVGTSGNAPPTSFAESASGAPGGSLERLRILCETSDGFRIAEEDLRLRGPGEMLGTRQHGLPTFRVADLIADFDLLEQARDDAAAILREDERLADPPHAALKRELIHRYGDTMALIDVG